jgi:hypothetical protein
LPYDDSINNTNFLYYGFCGDPNNLTPQQGAHYPPGLDTCTNEYLLPEIFSAFESNCMNQKSCNFSMTSFVNQTSNINTACSTNPAKVYMQYFCLQTTDQMNEKREQGLLISCSAGLASLVFLIVVYYLRKTEELDY